MNDFKYKITKLMYLCGCKKIRKSYLVLEKLTCYEIYLKIYLYTLLYSSNYIKSTFLKNLEDFY